VSVDTFKEQMAVLGIRLTHTQMQRLFLLLDENFTGSVSLEEYQEALEAYELAGERHFLTSGKGKPYHSLQNKALEALSDMMRQKNMTSDELFDMIDVNESGTIDLAEFKQVLQKVNPGMLIKEAKGIQTYFEQFDVNNNGTIERDEFNSLFDRIKRIVDKKKEMDLAAINEFDQDLEKGD